MVSRWRPGPARQEVYLAYTINVGMWRCQKSFHQDVVYIGRRNVQGLMDLFRIRSQSWNLHDSGFNVTRSVKMTRLGRIILLFWRGSSRPIDLFAPENKLIPCLW